MSTRPFFGILRMFDSENTRRISLRTLLSVAKERQTLKDLPAERLSDIGYSAAEAQIEANRALWDVPRHWKR